MGLVSLSLAVCVCASRFHSLPQLNSNGISETRVSFAVLKFLDRRHCRCVPLSLCLCLCLGISKIALYIVLRSVHFHFAAFELVCLGSRENCSVNCFFYDSDNKNSSNNSKHLRNLGWYRKSGKKNPFESFHTLFEGENVWPRRGKPEKLRRDESDREREDWIRV